MFESKNLLNGDVNYAFFLLYIISKNQSNYVYNLEKYTTFFKKKCFWFIQSTKLNLKCITKCSSDKTNNRNKTMFAITRKVLN